MPNKKPTDAEIIKAFKICNDLDEVGFCKDCPHEGVERCIRYTNQKILDLINRLQADVENYKQIAENQQKIILDKAFENKNLRAYIQNSGSGWGLVSHLEFCKNLKSEAYKEFAENNFGGCKGCINIGFRYPYASMYPCNNCIRADMKDYYEAKELVGEDNGNTE